MTKRGALKLSELHAVGSERAPSNPEATPPEPTANIYIRAPWSLAEELKDEARRRSKQEGRRVSAQDIGLEALRAYLKV